jgi:hypothetical protein
MGLPFALGLLIGIKMFINDRFQESISYSVIWFRGSLHHILNMVYHSGFYLLCVVCMMTTIIVSASVVVHDNVNSQGLTKMVHSNVNLQQN